MGITKRAVMLIWAGSLLLLLGMLLHVSFGIFIMYNGIILGLCLLDLHITPKAEDFKVERVWKDTFEIGKEKTLSIKVHHSTGHKIFLQLQDTIPAKMKYEHRSLSCICAPNEAATVAYTVCPMLRGNYDFGSIYVRYQGILGLCTRQFQADCSETIPVYPDLVPLKKYHLMAQQRQLQKHDAAIHKVHGMGTDFQNLREYNTDDEYRKINWTATARTNKLITGVYDEEKSQNVIIAIDTGRSMMSAAGDKSTLDYAIESALVLAQVALDRGDRVGLVIFGEGVKFFLKPSKGARQLNRILDAVYALQPQYYESDFNELAAYLGIHERKRSLLCIFSKFADEESPKELVGVLNPLNKKHALLMISLLNPGLKKLRDLPAEKLQNIYMKAAAVHKLRTEHQVSFILNSLGFSNIVAEPERLTPEVVNRYIIMKRQIKL